MLYLLFPITTVHKVVHTFLRVLYMVYELSSQDWSPTVDMLQLNPHSNIAAWKTQKCVKSHLALDAKNFNRQPNSTVVRKTALLFVLKLFSRACMDEILLQNSII